jgi:hypothetical protein
MFHSSERFGPPAQTKTPTYLFVVSYQELRLSRVDITYYQKYLGELSSGTGLNYFLISKSSTIIDVFITFCNRIRHGTWSTSPYLDLVMLTRGIRR